MNILCVKDIALTLAVKILETTLLLFCKGVRHVEFDVEGGIVTNVNNVRIVPIWDIIPA